MATIARITTWSSGDTLTATLLNGEFNNIINDYNGGITNANISASAAIATSKINTTFPSGTIVGTSDSQTLSSKTLTSPILNGTLSGDAFLDEDTMSSDSATKVPSQQSVKAYVDTSRADGWTVASDTLVYVSASSFKIASVDRTAIYTKGTRIKFTQTSAKYFVVTSSSFSTDTTVNIAVNTDYTIANATITAPYYSYQVSPQGYPTSFAYTTTLTGFSANPSDVTTRFSIIGNKCTVHAWDSAVGTSNATTKTWTVPVACIAGMQFGSTTWGLDNNVVIHMQCVLGVSSAVVSAYVGLPIGTLWTASGNCRLFPNGLTLIYEF